MKQRADYKFSEVPTASIPRSVFNRSHQYKTTFDAGYLIPFYVDEALPGDTFKCSTTVFARLGSLEKPIMDNLYLDVFFFAVPNRLVWDNWQKFCGEQIDPGDPTSFTVPQLLCTGATGSLGDYMGIPLGGATVGGAMHTVNSLAFRAYNLIYNEWFRDQNLIDSVVVDKDDGTDDEADYVLLKRGKRHDYFTSSLPWPQKGAAVELPLGTSAPVDITGAGDPTFDHADKTASTMRSRQFTGIMETSDLNPNATDDLTWNDPALTGVADLSAATASTINALREAFQIQKLLERDARGGTRYVEILKSHFGVTSPDFRLQRPEFLGGGTVPVMVHQAVSSVTDVGYVGDLGGFATGTGGGIGFMKSFVEHSMIIGIVCARADLTYFQGVNRMWTRQTRYDYYWPALAHLGEQAILEKEIFALGIGGGGADDGVFGYQERWAEYKYYPSMCTGLFRPTATGSLGFWHLAQTFALGPDLNEVFINEDPPVDRVINVPTEPHFLFDSYMRVETARPMPTYSVPGLIDHF